jgi:hypothetical protein
MTGHTAGPNVSRTRGALARFAGPAELLAAGEKLRDAGYQRFDCHSPFPIHGMSEAMGLGRSRLGWFVGMMAIIGGGGGLLLQWWSATIAYPLVISGKPFFSFQAFVPVTFCGTVLFSALGAVLGMFHLNRLPQWHHPVFFSDTFKSASDDGFLVSVEAEDPKFSERDTVELLKSAGATHVELLIG